MVEPTTLTKASVVAPLILASRKAGQRVRRLAGLRDDDGQCLRVHDRVTVAELAGDLHLDRAAQQVLVEVLARQARMVSRAAGDNDDPVEV